MKVEVLGTGCANCQNTVALIESVAKEKGVPLDLRKVEDIKDNMSYDVAATPGVVVDGMVVHAGGVPTRQRVEQWLGALKRCCG